MYAFGSAVGELLYQLQDSLLTFSSFYPDTISLSWRPHDHFRLYVYAHFDYLNHLLYSGSVVRRYPASSW